VTHFDIRPANEADLPVILSFIRELAEYEQLADRVTATVDGLRDSLFGPDRRAYALVAFDGNEPAGFALYFFNFSTFLGQPGLYLEDLFVRPAFRKRGLGRKLLARLAQTALERRCGRMEWAVLDWNEMALRVYRGIGAEPLSDWTLQRLTGDALRALAATA
jgi:GNAT superfamily N-acetyltransferase